MSKLKEKQNIPEGWVAKPLGEISKVVAGFGFPTRFQGKKEGKYLFAKVSDMNRPGNEKYISYAENYLDEDDLKKVKVKTYPIGTIVFPKVGAALLTNKRRILKKEALIDNNIMGLIPSNVDSMYLYYWMLNLDVTEHVAQGALPSINQGYVEKLELLLPESIAEQQKIAGILESVDAEIDQTKSVIKATEKLKKGLMQELFTHGIGHTKFMLIKLEDMAEVFSGKTPSRTKKNYYENGTIPWVKSTEIKFGTISDTFEKITDIAVQKENMRVVSKGAVLVAMYGQGVTRGKCAMLICDAATNQAIASIVPNTQKISQRYLFYWLMSQYENLRDLGHGGNQKNLNSHIIRTLDIPVCELKAQEKITKILSSVDEKIVVNRKLLAKQNQLKRGLMQDLLSGSKRVNV